MEIDRPIPYSPKMASRRPVPASEKLRDEAGATDRGYDDWKQAKIERALEQAIDRESLIPAETVWRDLGLER
ncbi:MAG: hypothetical protein JWN66_824 [Sphingomonas bacterium]|uniref:hypothetical protein n=1 Tax=Sphingomonas bacterium TaxID=1895847 RepID=UPI0026247B01|nr:hypothetical protein [Sphingomonas bacterium]MDB5703708.1 hypothetical protein [Sphingomonas bacterium]